MGPSIDQCVHEYSISFIRLYNFVDMMQSVNGILYDTISHFWIMIWQKYDALMMHDYADIDYAQMLLFVFIFLFTAVGNRSPLHET